MDALSVDLHDFSAVSAKDQSPAVAAKMENREGLSLESRQYCTFFSGPAARAGPGKLKLSTTLVLRGMIRLCNIAQFPKENLVLGHFGSDTRRGIRDKALRGIDMVRTIFRTESFDMPEEQLTKETYRLIRVVIEYQELVKIETRCRLRSDFDMARDELHQSVCKSVQF